MISNKRRKRRFNRRIHERKTGIPYFIAAYGSALNCFNDQQLQEGRKKLKELVNEWLLFSPGINNFQATNTPKIW